MFTIGKKIQPSFSKEVLQEYFSATGCKHVVCNAPFSGLYFVPDGTVKPCCALSPDAAFGNYNTTGIADLFKSDNRKKLQHLMKKNNLSFGCGNCASNIEKGNYTGSISSLYYKFSPGKLPEVIDFELSHFCNLSCEMCYLHTASAVENTVYGDAFSEEIKPFLKKLRTARFYGGEPFLIQSYYKIWEYIAQQNPRCHVHIQTNGTVLNEKILQVLGSCDTFIGVSIDAAEKDTYENIRRGASFDTVLKNAAIFSEIMQKQGKSLTISICPMPQNFKQIPEILKLADTLNAVVFFNTVNYPSRFNLGFITSDKLNYAATFLKDFRPGNSSNPNSLSNWNKLQGIIQGIEYMAKKNSVTEKRLTPLKTDDFIRQLCERIQEPEVSEKVLLLMNKASVNTHVNIYLQDYIAGIEPLEIKHLINRIVKNSDVNYLQNIFNTE
ncbi:MAG TPA: radical SAM protein [Bacteroidales bacterium]|nr:radical SAM protein [Bacteroidales bacterium]